MPSDERNITVVSAALETHERERRIKEFAKWTWFAKRFRKAVETTSTARRVGVLRRLSLGANGGASTPQTPAYRHGGQVRDAALLGWVPGSGVHIKRRVPARGEFDAQIPLIGPHHFAVAVDAAVSEQGQGKGARQPGQ
jgi:hypothetical protein